MKTLSERMRRTYNPMAYSYSIVHGWADEVAKLERENDHKEFAIKQVLMAREDGYDAPKIWQDLKDALLTAEEPE